MKPDGLLPSSPQVVSCTYPASDECSPIPLIFYR